MARKNYLNEEELNNWIANHKIMYASDKTYDKLNMRFYAHFNGIFSVTVRPTDSMEEKVIYFGASKEEALSVFNDHL